MGRIRLYKKYLQIHIQSRMQYKTSFYLTVMGQFLSSFNVFLGIYFLFQRFHQVEGFTYSEVLLCFSFNLMEFALAEMFARGLDSFQILISNGEFDRMLVRPRNEIFQVIASRLELSRIGRIFQTVFMLGYAVLTCQVSWNPAKILTVCSMLVGGTVVYSGIFLLHAAVCFFTIEGIEAMNVFTYGANEFGRYPVAVYGKKVLLFCTFVIPYALIQYYPLCYLLDRDSRSWYPFLPLVACLFLVPCYGIWRLGLRHYKSTGS